MPADERVWTDNRQQLPPHDDARQQREGDAGGVVGPLWPNLTFHVAGELRAQEHVLGGEVASGPECRSEQPQNVKEQTPHRSKHVQGS